MRTTTQEYKDAVYLTSRAIKGRVTLDISDVTAEGDVTSITANTQASYISSLPQLNDNDRKTTRKLATWETNRTYLDGSYSFPDEVTANNGEVGYTSAEVCNASGDFLLYPTITFTFGTLHSSAGLTVMFDPESGECATDFNVSVYSATDVLIYSSDVSGNTLLLCEVGGQFLNYKKIVFTIKKWSVGNRRARVAEFDFGIVRMYDGDKLISFNLVEDFDLTTGVIPSPEFKFTVDNVDRSFNILNPVGFFKYLQQRQPVTVELGLELADGSIEYLQIGKYMLWEWVSEEGSITATFTGRTYLDLMGNFAYERLTTASKSLKDLAIEILGICGITNYSIDDSLASITTNSLANKVDCKTALQMVALAGMCNIFVNSNGTITLKRMSSITFPSDRVDLDNVYAEPKIELEKIVKQVDVTYYTNLTTAAIGTATDTDVVFGDTLNLNNNTFINTLAQSQAVATWILNQKKYRAKYANNWRGNPAHELGDPIGIENTYGADMNAYITKQTLDYQGYLSAQTEAKGIPN
jgi:hypothetical protein